MPEPNQEWMMTPVPVSVPQEEEIPVAAILTYIVHATEPPPPPIPPPEPPPPPTVMEECHAAALACMSHKPFVDPPEENPYTLESHTTLLSQAWMAAQTDPGPADWFTVKEKLQHTGGGGN